MATAQELDNIIREMVRVTMYNKGITYAKLAELSGTCSSSVSDYLNKKKNIAFISLVKLLNALNLTHKVFGNLQSYLYQEKTQQVMAKRAELEELEREWTQLGKELYK